MTASDITRAARTNGSRLLALLATLAAIGVVALVIAWLPEPAEAHHRDGHEGGPQASRSATPTSTSPQPSATPLSPQPSPTPVSPQPTPTRTPLAEGERPGWGCGDDNHVHVGPPGNPDAESPCDKHDDEHSSAGMDDDEGHGHGNSHGHGGDDED